MSVCFNSTDDNSGGNHQIAAVYPEIFQFHILNRLDGPSLAYTSCTSSQFQSLCKDDQLWRKICNSTWPSTTEPRVRRAISSFPSAHHSFYRDSVPSHHLLQNNTNNSPDTTELISAVDVYYGEKVIFSKVLESETRSDWFLNYPFRIDLIRPEEIVPLPVNLETSNGGRITEFVERNLRVSWIVIDPTGNRAVNVSSRNAVEVRRQWIEDTMQLRYATVVGDGGGKMVQFAVIVGCEWKGEKLQMKEASMHVENIEGKLLNGKDSLGILQSAMEGERRIDRETEKTGYDTFLRMKTMDRERRQRRETGLDNLCVLFGLSIFFTFFFTLYYIFF